ncbi:MAG: hypothetical protein R3F59_37190 [Myxococcota bacterium]
MIALWSLLFRTAAAQDCAAPYSVDAMLDDLVAVETFLRNDDEPNAGKAADALRNGLGCLNEMLPRMIVGRTLRAVGAGLVAGGEQDVGEDWLRAAAKLEPSFEFGLEDLRADHPIRDVYAAAQRTAETDPVMASEGSALTAGTTTLDGKEIEAPSARLDQWHLLQHEGADGGVQSWVIEGNRFPEAILQAAAPVASGKEKKAKEPKPPKGPKEAKAPKPPSGAPPGPRPAPSLTDQSERIDRVRPAEKTPIMVAGGAVVVGAGALYYLSYAARQRFDDEQRDLGALEKNYRQTNQLAIAAMAVLAVGGGTFTWGAILDGGTAMPAVRVRF